MRRTGFYFDFLIPNMFHWVASTVHCEYLEVRTFQDWIDFFSHSTSLVQAFTDLIRARFCVSCLLSELVFCLVFLIVNTLQTQMAVFHWLLSKPVSLNATLMLPSVLQLNQSWFKPKPTLVWIKTKIKSSNCTDFRYWSGSDQNKFPLYFFKSNQLCVTAWVEADELISSHKSYLELPFQYLNQLHHMRNHWGTGSTVV